MKMMVKEARIPEERRQILLTAAMKVISHPEFTFSSWRNLAVEMRYRGEWLYELSPEEMRAIHLTPTQALREFLITHKSVLSKLLRR